MTILLGTGACAPFAQANSAPPLSPSARGADGTVSLKTGAVRQTVAGFGASGCWWAQDVGGWQQDKVDKIVELLFNKEKGIGLNIYRFEVGGGGVNESSDPWRRAETFEVSPGAYDWSRDANAVNVLRKAVSAGVDDVMFFANTPPGRMTANGRTTGGDDGAPNLKPGMEGDFARYLVDIALHFKSEGIPVKYISPVNEPQWTWQTKNGQEGCHYEPDQIVTVAEALVKELAGRGAGIKPSLIDSGKWFDNQYTVEMYKTLAQNPIVGPAMDHYAVHSYWSADTDKQTAMKLLQGTGADLPLWQTEWCQMDAERDLGMDAALVLAECVHEDMTITDCSAWIAWLAVSCYDYKDGLVYVDLGSRQVLDSKRLWALGNYSRFVLPGYKRIDLAGDAGNMLASAYMSPDEKTAVIVAINPGDKPKALSIAATGFSSYEAYETSEAHSLDLVASGKPGKYTFPPVSVTTLVMKK